MFAQRRGEQGRKDESALMGIFTHTLLVEAHGGMHLRCSALQQVGMNSVICVHARVPVRLCRSALLYENRLFHGRAIVQQCDSADRSVENTVTHHNQIDRGEIIFCTSHIKMCCFPFTTPNSFESKTGESMSAYISNFE